MKIVYNKRIIFHTRNIMYNGRVGAADTTTTPTNDETRTSRQAMDPTSILGVAENKPQTHT